MVAIELQPEFGLVVLEVALTVVIHSLWMGFAVGAARKKYGCKYPDMYLPGTTKAARTYNCIQRAHQNSLENLPSFLALLLVAGARYPLPAAAAGAVVLLGRVLYFQGYATGDPAKRYRGSFLHLGTLVLLGMTCRLAWELLAPLLGR